MALALLMGCVPAGRAEIIDRLAVSVGNAVITESEIDVEIRMASFLNGEQPDFTPASRRKAADRLVEQKLIRREVQLSRYPAPAKSEIEPMLKRTVAGFPDPAAFRAALEKYGITEQELLAHLAWQMTFLRFIDVRFRPGIQVTDQEIQDYYNKVLLPAARNPGEKVTLEAARDKIEEILTAQRVDRDLNQWLRGARQRARVEYREDAFQ